MFSIVFSIALTASGGSIGVAIGCDVGRSYIFVEAPPEKPVLLWDNGPVSPEALTEHCQGEDTDYRPGTSWSWL
jgi:hypothetical protein